MQAEFQSSTFALLSTKTRVTRIDGSNDMHKFHNCSPWNINCNYLPIAMAAECFTDLALAFQKKKKKVKVNARYSYIL